MKRLTFYLLTFLILQLSLATTALAKDRLVIYSARKAHLIEPLIKAYTEATGVEIVFLTDKAGPLLQKLKAEGESTEADLLITVDAGNLWHAAEEGLLDSVDSLFLEKNIPSHFRDPNQKWFGLSVRARTIVYHKQRVKEGELVTYEGLADPIWKGRLCLRTSKKVYNQSLVAMMIVEHGEEKTEKVVKGWVKNLAAPVFSSDTKVIEAINAGQCDVGIVNTYYFGRWQKKEKNSSKSLALFWPNQDQGGVHVNVSGAGIVKASKNKKEATAFLEWLSKKEAQKLFADVNLEYPANPNVKLHPTVAAWGDFKQNVINVSKAGEHQKAAVRLMDRMGYK